MNYKETCDYLFKLTSFETQGRSGLNPGLDIIEKLDEELGHPHTRYRCIHIAGTNGKGSTAHTTAAILQHCGYRTGLFTSPHLVDFRERIRVNGQPVSQEFVVNFVEKHRHLIDRLHASFFEITTAMALEYFHEMRVDIAVIEVGLGGRLDSTNIIQPIMSVITNISLDHTQILGSTLEQIAMEKAGIIKKGTRAIIGETTPETRPVFEAVALELEAPITFAEDEPEVISAEPTANGGMRYKTQHYGTLQGELGGIYQAKNTNTVLHIVRELERQGYMYRHDNDRHTDDERRDVEIGHALMSVSATTGLAGRWQIIQREPTVVCDTGHNVGGWQYISEQLARVECDRMHIIFGIVDDKDLEGILGLLPRKATYYFTKAHNKRAVSETVVKMLANSAGLEGEAYATVGEAWNAAKAAAERGDFVFVGGSSYVVADFLKNSI